MKSALFSTLSLFLLLGLLTLGGSADFAQAAPDRPAPVGKEPIVMWSGLLADIPKGWQLCDGTNGTPDLRNRFVQCVYDGQNMGETGGAHEVQLSVYNLPSHSHGFTTSYAGDHRHVWYDKYGISSIYEPAGLGSSYSAPYADTYPVNRTTSEDGYHFHRGQTSYVGSGAPFDNRPSYFRLAFITRPCLKPKQWSSALGASLGSIVIWPDSSQPIPEGWQLCDGAGGTPDLRDRFVLGVEAGHDPGEVGGESTLWLDTSHLPSHYHPLYTDFGGDHTHPYEDTITSPTNSFTYGGYIPYSDILVGDEDEASKSTSPAGEHSHSGTTYNKGGGGAIDNRPSFYRMPFIMMTSTKGPRSSEIPVGSAALWANDLAGIPEGWQLCDGTLGTPDLRNRFALGGEVSGEYGGADWITLTEQTMPTHTHPFTTDIDGSHSHGVTDSWRMSSNVWVLGWQSYSIAAPPFTSEYDETDSRGNHTHGGNTDPAGWDAAYENRPAYYKAALIMRLS